MASKVYYGCVKCQQQTPAGNLFDALLEISKGVESRCATCGEERQLHKIFDFGLGALRPDFKLLHAVCPRENELVAWEQDGGWITFYPFLVIMESVDEKSRAFWLPYWHIVDRGGTKQRKYGQFAPFLEEPIFKSLLAQAREKGYLPE
jgi:DNA-directed RNA polymerase subunit RPC12/RpoP